MSPAGLTGWLDSHTTPDLLALVRAEDTPDLARRRGWEILRARGWGAAEWGVLGLYRGLVRPPEHPRALRHLQAIHRRRGWHAPDPEPLPTVEHPVALRRPHTVRLAGRLLPRLRVQGWIGGLQAALTTIRGK